MASRLSLNQVQGCRGRGVVNLDLNHDLNTVGTSHNNRDNGDNLNLDLNLDLNTVGTSHNNRDNLNLIENTPRITKQGEGNTVKHIEIDNDKW